jgi:uncharacterized protein
MTDRITDERLSAYRATAARRRDEDLALAEERRARGWLAAREGAQILRYRFGATRVLAFGSLVGGHWFGPASDLDLAASGLRLEEYFGAVAALQGLGGEFRVDLVDLDRCPERLKEAIEAAGTEL